MSMKRNEIVGIQQLNHTKNTEKLIYLENEIYTEKRLRSGGFELSIKFRVILNNSEFGAFDVRV